MGSLFDFSQSISKLNKEKKFSESLRYFKEFKKEFTPAQIGLNKFIVYEVILALIETNQIDLVFKFIEQYNIVLDTKNFSYLLKKIKDKPTVNWTFINKFCDLVTVELLDTECRTIEVVRKGERKPMELASNKEDWFALKTKALFESERYQECFELSKIALESFEKFHYSNEVWFARRIALSKKHLGNPDEALNELLLILRRKKEWFIQNEVAQLYKEKGEYENAFKFAISAINNFGDLEYKVGLIVLLAELLALKNEKELAFKHYSLSKLLRQHEEWNVPNTLYLVLNEFSFEQIHIEKLPDLIKELKKYWSGFIPTKSKPEKITIQRKVGKIYKILHNDDKGADGFIKYDGNKSIYFRVNITEKIIKKIVVGLEVEFKILPSTEEKKEKAIQLNIN